MTEIPLLSKIREIVRQELKVKHESPYMTSEEVGSFLRLKNHRSMQKWRSNGKGPKYTTVGGRNLYRREDVEQWVAEQD